jgi:hypothetical protein
MLLATFRTVHSSSPAHTISKTVYYRLTAMPSGSTQSGRSGNGVARLKNPQTYSRILLQTSKSTKPHRTNPANVHSNWLLTFPTSLRRRENGFMAQRHTVPRRVSHPICNIPRYALEQDACAVQRPAARDDPICRNTENFARMKDSVVLRSMQRSFCILLRTTGLDSCSRRDMPHALHKLRPHHKLT